MQIQRFETKGFPNPLGNISFHVQNLMSIMYAFIIPAKALIVTTLRLTEFNSLAVNLINTSLI